MIFKAFVLSIFTFSLQAAILSPILDERLVNECGRNGGDDREGVQDIRNELRRVKKDICHCVEQNHSALSDKFCGKNKIIESWSNKLTQMTLENVGKTSNPYCTSFLSARRDIHFFESMLSSCRSENSDLFLEKFSPPENKSEACWNI